MNRLLETVYAIVYFDALVVKVLIIGFITYGCSRIIRYKY